LVLTRRPGEAVQIGESVRIKVLDVRGDRVRFGIDAPRDVPVDREEIYELKRRKAAGGVVAEGAGK